MDAPNFEQLTHLLFEHPTRRCIVWRFILPFPDNTVLNVAVGGKDINAAFEDFRKNWWLCTMTGAIAVFHNAALVGRVLPIYSVDTDEMDCFLQEWP